MWPTSEIASFTEHPFSWLIWGINLVTIIAMLIYGFLLSFRLSRIEFLPLTFVFLVKYGWAWVLKMPTPFPKVVTGLQWGEEQIKAGTLEGAESYTGVVNGSIDWLLWGATATVIICFYKLKISNQSPQRTPAAARPPPLS